MELQYVVIVYIILHAGTFSIKIIKRHKKEIIRKVFNKKQI